MSTPKIPMAGSEPVWALLAVLADPKKVKARLEELETATAKLETRLEEVGVAGEIESARARSKAEKQEAGEIKARSLVEADALRAAAIEERDRALVEASAIRRDLAVQRKALDDAVGKAAREAKAREDSMTRREQAVAGAAEAAAQQMRAAQAIRAEFETRLERLKAATAAAG